MKDITNNTVARRKKILQLLEEKSQILVPQLSQSFGVSEVTIRNDLDVLEKKNMLIKVRGGAIKIESNVSVDQNLSEKSRLHYREKSLIGQKSAGLIKESETILLDSGTTTMHVADNLAQFSEITLLTNALNIANHVGSFPGTSVIILGGYLRKKSYSLIGPLAENALKNFHVDKLFLGVDGFDTQNGIYTPNVEEAHLNQLMIEVSQEVIVVADSSKFNNRSFALISNLDKIDQVVTDKGITKEDKQRLLKAGIEVLVA